MPQYEQAHDGLIGRSHLDAPEDVLRPDEPKPYLVRNALAQALSVLSQVEGWNTSALGLMGNADPIAKQDVENAQLEAASVLETIRADLGDEYVDLITEAA